MRDFLLDLGQFAGLILVTSSVVLAAYAAGIAFGTI